MILCWRSTRKNALVGRAQCLRVLSSHDARPQRYSDAVQSHGRVQTVYRALGEGVRVRACTCVVRDSRHRVDGTAESSPVLAVSVDAPRVSERVATFVRQGRVGRSIPLVPTAQRKEYLFACGVEGVSHLCVVGECCRVVLTSPTAVFLEVCKRIRGGSL